MSFETFRDALVQALPGLRLSEDDDELPPDEYTRVAFHLAPVRTGVRLTIRLSGNQYAIDVADEQEAADVLSRLMNLAS